MHKFTTKEELVKYNSLILDQSIFFENNATPLMIVNKDRIMVKLNQKFAELFGYEKEELLGRQTIMLTPNEKMFEDYAAYFQITKDRKNRGKEFQYKKKDGTLFWVKLEGNPIYEKDDEILILWTFMDVTQEVVYREELKRLVSIDPMTELYNRRYFYDVAGHIIDIAKRDKTDVSILMIDIDDFKKINDSFGHQIGDEVIISLSHSLKILTRKSDIICRFGGEEFLILLPNTTEKGAYSLAELIRKTVLNIHRKVSNSKLKFTVSIGVFQVELQKNLDYSIDLADKALYRAKKSGKNKICKS